jgi:tetratricopeptide (TPR) repeat protein
MSPERFRRMEALYDKAATLDTAERARFIEEQCGGDEELRGELVAAFGDGTNGLTTVVEAAAAGAAETEDKWTGRRVGPYRIVRPLGRGGMGAVYLAVRDDDEFHKEVAIKTLKFELEGGPSLSRFRHERQILANLEHPNIARLLDGGTTEQGTPYIVLEYVPGVPLTDWCEQQQLSIEQRLRLFRQVCDAVQYAHQHLIVHRDIKPSNILVTAEGVPKLLDFGIAKLLDSGSDTGEPAPTATATGAMLMTPDYASPEQFLGGEISTATDLYSLGNVLYELLTGQRPYSFQNYDAVTIARAVCEEEIRPPSALGNRRLRGDLDLIVLKAMQKEPSRRYTSVVELSEDIRRHLEGLPITARPDTLVYRATKFIRRHWAGVAAAVAVVAALAVGLAVSLYEARIAQRRFAQVRELANTFLFQFYDQVTPLVGSVEVRKSIVDTARKYLDGLSQEAGGDKDLILELAQAYQRLGDVQGRPGVANLGQVDEARRSYQRAVDLYSRARVKAGSPLELRRKMKDALGLWVSLEFYAGHEDAAEPLKRRELELFSDRALDPETRMLRASTQRGLGTLRLRQGYPAEGLALIESAVQSLHDLRSRGYSDKQLADEIHTAGLSLAMAKAAVGDLDGALNAYLELIRDNGPCDEHGPPSKACRTLWGLLIQTAAIYGEPMKPNLNELGKAARMTEQALRILERITALDPKNQEARDNLAIALGEIGNVVWKEDPKRALTFYERSLATAKSLASKEKFLMIEDAILAEISRPLIQLGRLAQARKALSEEMRRSASNPPTQYEDRLADISVGQNWASLLLAEGNWVEARKALEKTIRDTDALRASRPSDFAPIYFLSESYRMLASMTSGQERRDALLHSAALWHSWPATSYTKREEQKDLAAANQ